MSIMIQLFLLFALLLLLSLLFKGLSNLSSVLPLGVKLAQLQTSYSQQNEYNKHLGGGNYINTSVLVDLTPVSGHYGVRTLAQVGEVDGNCHHVQEERSSIEKLVGLGGLVQLDKHSGQSQGNHRVVNVVQELGH